MDEREKLLRRNIGSCSGKYRNDVMYLLSLIDNLQAERDELNKRLQLEELSHQQTLDFYKGQLDEIREAWEPFRELLEAHDTMQEEFEIELGDDCLIDYVDGTFCTPSDLRKLNRLIKGE